LAGRDGAGTSFTQSLKKALRLRRNRIPIRLVSGPIDPAFQAMAGRAPTEDGR
jgi:hypothetical protein